MVAKVAHLHGTEEPKPDAPDAPRSPSPGPTLASLSSLSTEAKLDALAGLLGSLERPKAEKEGKGEKGKDDGSGATPKSTSWLQIIFGMIVAISLAGDFLRPLLISDDQNAEILTSIENLSEKVDSKFSDLEREVIALRVAQDQQAEAFLDYVAANKETAITPDSVLSYIAYIDTQDRTRKILQSKEKQHESNPNH